MTDLIRDLAFNDMGEWDMAKVEVTDTHVVMKEYRESKAEFVIDDRYEILEDGTFKLDDNGSGSTGERGEIISEEELISRIADFKTNLEDLA